VFLWFRAATIFWLSVLSTKEIWQQNASLPSAITRGEKNREKLGIYLTQSCWLAY